MTDNRNKPVIFLAFANDRDDSVGYLRNLPDESRRLRDVLEHAEQAGLCEVIVRSNSTGTDIFKVFQDPRYRNRIAIFHYGGHANGYQLLLESAEGKSTAADAGGLAAFLAQQRGLQLVFLNGCSTQQQTEGLLDANVPAVIATSRSIDDQVATNFAYQFYQGLAGGATIGTAYNEAEAYVQTAKGANTRALYFGNQDVSKEQLEADRWPWNLYLRQGSELTDQWNLPQAVNDPLFGLPPLPEQDLPESPYRHLNWFRREDAEVFFGRGHEIRELYDRLTTLRSAPILLLYGQSGVGKSSLLDAGVIPRLESQCAVEYERRADGGLVGALRRALQLPRQGGVIEDAWTAREAQLGRPLVVILDQVEELYTRPIEEIPNELEDFLKIVHETFADINNRPRGKLVLAFRKEWLAEIESRLNEYELPRTRVFLERLGRHGIVEAVRGPTSTERLQEKYGLRVDDDLPEIIADDLREDRDSAVAPTLQILLTKLWSQAKQTNYEQPQLTQDLYQQLSRNGILLGDFLDQQIEEIHRCRPNAVDSGLLLDIISLHTTPLGTANQRSLEQLQQVYAHVADVLPDLLQLCQDLYLLTITVNHPHASSRTTRLAHDTLAPLIRQRFDQSDKPGQRARRILDARVRERADGRQADPLDQTDLKTVEEGRQGTKTWSPQEEQLVSSSRNVRARRRIAWTFVAVAIAVASGVAGWKWYEAETNLQIAKLSVKDKLNLYLYWPRQAGHIAAADTAEEARAAFNELIKNDDANTVRLATPNIVAAATNIQASIMEWENYEGSLEVWHEQHPASKCRLGVLDLVKHAISGLELTWAADSPIDDASRERRRQMERDLVNREFTERARQVTRNIANSAPDPAAMSVWKKEFERLYWAELWWVELQHAELTDEEHSPLELAMVDYRQEGLHDWNLAIQSPDSKEKLNTLANAVGQCCDDLLARSVAAN